MSMERSKWSVRSGWMARHEHWPKVSLMALVSALALTAGCGVPAAQYDAAVAAGARERAGQQAARRSLDEARRRVAELEGKLEERELALSQVDYDVGVVTRERDDARQIVDQLRGELGRIARDLRQYAERNRELAETLERAERSVQRLEALEAEADERAQLLRDLGLALRDDLIGGAASLALRDRVPVVGLRIDVAFAADGTLTRPARQAVQEVVQIVAPLSSRTVEVTAAPTGEPPSVRAGRIQQVRQELTEAGLPPSRVGTPAAQPGIEPGWIFMVIRRSP